MVGGVSRTGTRSDRGLVIRWSENGLFGRLQTNGARDGKELKQAALTLHRLLGFSHKPAGADFLGSVHGDDNWQAVPRRADAAGDVGGVMRSAWGIGR